VTRVSAVNMRPLPNGKMSREAGKELHDRSAAKERIPVPMPAYEPLRSEPWLQWPQETAHQYEAFTVFRDLEPRLRSLSRTAYIRRYGQPPPELTSTQVNRQVNTKTGHVSKWANRFHWRERVDAFDRYGERQRIAELQKGQLEAYREMGDRHAREAVALQAKAVARLQRLDPDELSAGEVRQFIIAAATLERLSRGASLQDMAVAQRENVAAGRAIVTARIEYVDDWRGDRERLERLKSQNSRYGNGQGLLPQDVDDGVTPVRVNGTAVQGEGRAWLTERLTQSGDEPAEPDPDGSEGELPLSETP
jgi:hypothetical protein